MSKKILITVIKYFYLALIISVILVPIVWIMSLGFRYPDEVYQIFPTKFTFMNIVNFISYLPEYSDGISFFRMFGNSMFVTGVSLVGILIVSSLAAFGFSNYEFRFKEVLFITFLLSFMIPVQVLLIPIFLLMKNLNLFKSYLIVILPYIAIQFPIATLILRAFFEKIPIEFKESAKLDGATDFFIFTKIVLPLAKPAIATVSIFSFLSVWNEFLFALVFLRQPNMKTIPLVLNKLIGGAFIKQWEIYGAGVILTVIPVVIIFIVFQRWFIAGLAEGAVKG